MNQILQKLNLPFLASYSLILGQSRHNHNLQLGLLVKDLMLEVAAPWLAFWTLFAVFITVVIFPLNGISSGSKVNILGWPNLRRPFSCRHIAISSLIDHLSFIALKLILKVSKWAGNEVIKMHKKIVKDFHFRTLKLMSHVSHLHYVFTNTAISFVFKLLAYALYIPSDTMIDEVINHH